MFRQFVLTFYRRCGQVGSDDLNDDEHKATEDLLVDCGSYLFFFRESAFVSFFEQKTRVLFKDFQEHISCFLRTPFSAK